MKTKKLLIIVVSILFVGLVITIISASLYLFRVELVSRPSLEFKEPLNGQTLPKGDMLVRFIARDKGGIEHIELWADGKLVASKKSSLPNGSSPFPMVETWRPESSGQHTLTARAYNQSKQSSLVSVVIQVSDQEGQMYEVLGKDQAEGISGDASINPDQLEGYSDLGPDSRESLDSGDVVVVPADTGGEEGMIDIPAFIDDRIAIAPLNPYEGELNTPFLDAITGFLVHPPFANLQLLQVEALTLETDRAYDGVFCYFSLADSPVEKVPSEGFVHSLGSNAWDIQALVGGENKRMVVLGEGENQLLHIWVNCWGAIYDAGGVYELGTVNMVHTSSDWNGNPIEQRADGPSGWFKLNYRIIRPGGTGGGDGDEDEIPLPAPVMYHYCYELGSFDQCELLWYYPEDARELIDGYLLIRDHNDTEVIGDAEKRKVTLVEFMTGPHGLPACGQTDTFEVVAFKGDPYTGKKSDYSNAITISSEPCYSYAKVTFDYLYTGCLSGDEYINTCGRRAEEPGDVEGPLTATSPYAVGGEDEGCNYADLWANDQIIDIGAGSGMYVCYRWASGGLYKISEINFVETDTLLVPLDKDENLAVGMNVIDDDEYSSDDLQCYGEYIHTFGELQGIAASPDKKYTYIRSFYERGGGGCDMQYTIEIMPPDFLSGAMSGGYAAP
ncbi:MAG: Ig-like domain-containing protein [Anaerolineaceae bacterium]|nr:Ig-like domain-containing protein [Anaerolineaceae bacterium]